MHEIFGSLRLFSQTPRAATNSFCYVLAVYEKSTIVGRDLRHLTDCSFGATLLK